MESMRDLLLVIDATASMSTYLDALRQSVPEILALSKLSGAFGRVGVLAYRDYCEKESERIEWSGWNNDELAAFASSLQPIGGGDYPEAAKTALVRAMQHCSKDRHTLMLWYTDAPPHYTSSMAFNAVQERKEFPKKDLDWITLSYIAKQRNCSVFSFVPPGLVTRDSLFYVFLSQVTGGNCIISPATESVQISRLTLDVILQRMGLLDGVDITNPDTQKYGETIVRRYRVSPLDTNPKPSNEGDGCHGYLITTSVWGADATRHAPVEDTPFDLSAHIPTGPLASPRHHSLAKRFADPAEADYRATVYVTLTSLINSNAYALTYNPVFGQLWRAVCKERLNDAKQGLLDAFSQSVGQLTDPKQKADMQQWLEESFDATEEINELIGSVDADAPRVYLDLDAEVQLTRKELLEVSKSCYAGVLQKLTSIFTHLKIVEKDVVLGSNQRSIPLSLGPRDFFRTLPHLVVPGTLYPPRAAALTAILALVTGVSFLQDPATSLLAPFKGTWLDLEVPENLSFECARLLLSAPEGTALTDKERDVYEAMRRYRVIELNLSSTLAVKLPWTPMKTRQVGDQKVQCRKCLIRRSVTIMSHEKSGVCGLCTADALETDKKSDPIAGTDEMNSCWVECSMKTCRAQYVVEDVANLRVRPKCHYCRVQTVCPWMECTRCTNRIIVPLKHRTVAAKDYLCPGCANSSCVLPTIATSKTTIAALVNENGRTWIDLSDNADLLQGKSAFKLMQAHGFTVFDPVTSKKPVKLVVGEKTVHNVDDVRMQVENRVGRGEIELGCCPLCFNDRPYDKLLPACGRSKCAHRIDETCLAEWYGRNEPGKLLNLMQFSCPFCRRTPVTKVLTRHNPRAAALGGLRDAIGDTRWYYAWCVECGFAKRALERQCCEGERLDVIEEFRCADCRAAVVDVEDRFPPKAEKARTQIGCECPGCGVMVQKTFGCNHITCRCGQHFCYVCGEGRNEDDIYGHMAQAHGGFYDDSDEDDI